MSRKIEVGTETFVRFWLVIIAFAIPILFIYVASTALLIIGLAIFLAVAISPLVRKIDPERKRHGLSTTLAVVLIVGAIGLILAVVGPVVVSETTKFIAQGPSATGRAQGAEFIDSIGQNFGVEHLSSELWARANQFLQDNIINGLGEKIVANVGSVISVITGAVLTLVLTILFLLEGPDLVKKFWGFVAAHKKEQAAAWENVVAQMADVIAKYVTGQLSVAILDGIVVAIVIAGASFIFDISATLAIPMGLTTMVCYMIPMIGPIIGAIIVGLVLFFSSPVAAVSFVVFYIVYQQIESNVIAPKVQGNRLQLPVSVILSAIVIGMYVFGLLGAIISIPIAGCIKVLVNEYPNLRKID